MIQVPKEPNDQQEEWIPWGSAAKIFEEAGLSNSTFTRSRDDIRKRNTHKKRGTLYFRGDVEAFANRKTKKSVHPTVQPATFHQVTPEDMPELAILIEEIFGGSVDIARWQERIRKNPESGFLLREGTNGTGRVVGCEFIYPHTEAHIRQILSNYVSLVSNPEDILMYEPEGHVNLYIRTVGITTQVTNKQKRHWAAILIRNCMRFLEDLGHRGVIIDNIWSRSETKDGVNILRHMGFTQLESNNAYRNFVIDVPLSGLPMIVRYKRAYQEWQQKNSGEVG